MSTKHYKRGVSPALDRSSRRSSCGRSGGEQLAFRAQRADPAQPAATQHRIKDESALLFIFFQFVEKVCLNCLNHFVAVT